MNPEKSVRTAKFQVRARSRELELIDAAAERLGKSRSEFIMETARQRAQDVLSDQRVFRLEPEAWDAFVKALDAPVEADERARVARLLNKRTVWDSDA